MQDISIAMLYRNHYQPSDLNNNLFNNNELLVKNNEVRTDSPKKTKRILDLFYRSKAKVARLIKLNDLYQLGVTLTPPPHARQKAINDRIRSTRTPAGRLLVFTLAYERDGITEGNGFVPSEEPDDYQEFRSAINEGDICRHNFIYNPSHNTWHDFTPAKLSLLS